MKLSALLADLTGAVLHGPALPDGDVNIRLVCDDSRSVEPGDLFVAVRGLTSDGHAFVEQAVARGAAAVVVEEAISGVEAPQVVVPDSALALGLLAARMHGRPGDDMTVIAVTGTNGKTTVTYLVEAILTAAGARPGVIGTVSYRYGGKSVPAPYTTPTPLELHRTFAEMVDAGCTHAVLEASSAAISMDRLAGLKVDVAAFTNLSQDHLDVHRTMEEYCAAKARLFSDHLARDGVAAAIVDDPVGHQMLQRAESAGARALAVSASSSGEVSEPVTQVHVLSAQSSIGGIEAELATPRGPIRVTSDRLLGQYNIANVALAIAIAEAIAVPHDAIAEGIRTLAGVPGRVERVANQVDLDVLVDYAHTPDALANVLDALRPLCQRRLICLFGCGGDRDPSKRPLMGRAVSDRADLAVVTSDNPRTEDPDQIIAQILPAVPSAAFVHRDRRTAIRAAVAEATPGDILLIAGKGHEDYQVLGTEKIHFDDREEAAAAIAARETIPLAMIAKATGGAITAGPTGSHTFGRVVIDGRIAAQGDLYVAIRGDRFDGHGFCDQALAAGARGLMVERPETAERDPAAVETHPEIPHIRIEVADTRIALGQVARAVRRRWGKPLVGITGSTGKTSTKELIAAALGTTAAVHATSGSLNNETGVPLTLLGLRAHHDLAVVEMGMRALGEISYLADLAEPQVGVVVNAGVAHVGVVGSEEAIARGKGELFAHLAPGGCAVYPAGDDRLAKLAAAAARTLTFGAETTADVRLVAYRADGEGSLVKIATAEGEREARLGLVGRHNAVNATCAIAAALALGSDLDDAIAGLGRARAPAQRSQIMRCADRRILLDCYNANPTSMAAALATIADLARADAPGQTGRAVAVLGDMLELGERAQEAHRRAGTDAARSGLHLIALGDHAPTLVAAALAAGGTAEQVDDPDEAAAAALAASSPGDWILIKASRGLRLERVADALQKSSRGADAIQKSSRVADALQKSSRGADALPGSTSDADALPGSTSGADAIEKSTSGADDVS